MKAIQKHMSSIIAPLLIAVSLAGCSRSPEADVPVRPASEAATAPDAAPIPQSPEAGASQANEVSIVYAQIGNKLGANNLLAESLAELGSDGAVYAMAVFRSPGQKEATAGVKIMDASGKEVFGDSKPFVSEGETPVVFQLMPSVGALQPGDHKALFTLNGVPCWEISFKVT